MIQRCLAIRISPRSGIEAGSVDSQYFVGSLSPFGHSISNQPCGNRNSSRDEVVCIPRLSCSLTACVACRSTPNKRFSIVDLPTPEDPASAAVSPKLT